MSACASRGTAPRVAPRRVRRWSPAASCTRPSRKPRSSAGAPRQASSHTSCALRKRPRLKRRTPRATVFLGVTLATRSCAAPAVCCEPLQLRQELVALAIPLGRATGARLAPHIGECLDHLLVIRPFSRLAADEPGKSLQLQTRETLRPELVVVERLPRHRCDGAHDLSHRLCIHPYLVLRVGIEAQLEEVKDVVQIALPVRLGV